MNEEEVKQLVQSEMDRYFSKYYKRSYPGFNIESGGPSQNNGETEYCMTTDTAQGFHFYKKGNCKIGANKSIELYAGGSAGVEDISVVISAEDGHVVIEAVSGDLTLRGNNIVLETNDGDGAIVANGAKNFRANAPQIDIQGTKVNMMASMDVFIAGSQTSTYSQSGPGEDGDGTEVFEGGIFDIILQVLDDKRKKFFSS